ncbi:MAG: HEAT repeat domain-containing protein [Armatimonadetes bacterium]|nr:HEAT repeat domain-containing protein [Armatimonadota bacterium]MCX7968425.1 HEAT repeat domain-containing protein [Armatimonadota bacterium]MDW8142263.1 HEAT repeat domain-containing protein [Armatimonadota bacterium]
MRVWSWVLVLSALTAPIVFAQPSPDLQKILQQLQSEENATRLQAMEKAPEFGAAIIPHLPPLLNHKDWRVQRAAQIVLENIATRATKLGAKEKVEIVNALLTLTKPNQPIAVRKFALNAIAICGGDEVVPALSNLLKDEQVREDALNALKQIGSPAAAKAVAYLASTAKGNWLRELLATLGEMGRPEGVPVLLTMLKTGDAQTKSVTAEALGRIGDARAIPALVNAVQQGVPSAYDALVRTGELTLQRKQTSSAVTAFEHALKLAKTEHEKCAALIGLGKTGAAKALPILVDALDEPEVTVREAAKEALTAYRHPDSSRGFAQMFQRANVAERIQLLRVLVERNEPNVTKLLQQSAASQNEELRLTALEQMGRIDDLSLERTLWEAVLKGDVKTKTVALRSYLQLAELRARKGKSELARSMFEQGLKIAEQNNLTELRDMALAGLALLGDPKSLPTVQRYLTQPEPPRQALAAAVAIANTLAREGRRDEAVSLLRNLLSMRMPRDLGIQSAQILSRLGEDPSAIPRQSGFIVRWWLLGPLPNPDNRAFDQAFIDETSSTPLKLETVRVDNRLLRWREIRTFDPQGVVDLRQFFRQTEWVACYAYTEFVVENDMEAELRVGSDDSVKVWLNGKLVHQFGDMRGLSVDQDRIRVRLQKGVNRLLLKVTQGGGGWEFCVRLVDLQGNPITYREP